MRDGSFTDSADLAVEQALAWISRRERTVGEVRKYLGSRGCAEADITEAIIRLNGMGYLDDAKYAVRFAEDRRTLDGWGNDRIDRRLRELGIDDNCREAALADSDHEAEVERALGILNRKLDGPAADARSYNRAMGLLLRRGYDGELAAQAIRAHRAAFG